MYTSITKESFTHKKNSLYFYVNHSPINRLVIIQQSDITDEIKLQFFQIVAVSVLLYVCTTWIITKCKEEKLDGNYIRMLRTVMKKNPGSRIPQSS